MPATGARIPWSMRSRVTFRGGADYATNHSPRSSDQFNVRSSPSTSRVDAGLLLLRIAVAVVVLFHGVFKLRHGVAWIGGPLGKVGLPAWLAYGAYVAELLAPVLLILGILARWAALAIVVDMLMAIYLVLRPRVITINQSGGGWGIELEALICLSALTIAIAGSGRFAVLPDR